MVIKEASVNSEAVQEEAEDLASSHLALSPPKFESVATSASAGVAAAAANSSDMTESNLIHSNRLYNF
jgi:hypothetical protein